MKVFIEPNRIAMQGTIGQILAWLEKLPKEMPLKEYIHLSLH